MSKARERETRKSRGLPGGTAYDGSFPPWDASCFLQARPQLAQNDPRATAGEAQANTVYTDTVDRGLVFLVLQRSPTAATLSPSVYSFPSPDPVRPSAPAPSDFTDWRFLLIARHFTKAIREGIISDGFSRRRPNFGEISSFSNRYLYTGIHVMYAKIGSRMKQLAARRFTVFIAISIVCRTKFT